MSKRFAIRYRKDGAIKTCSFVVDDDCASLVRGQIWTVSEDRNGNRYVALPSPPTSKEQFLHKQITECPGGHFVAFKNQNTLDLRRENLLVMPKSKKGTYAQRRRDGMEIAA